MKKAIYSPDDTTPKGVYELSIGYKRSCEMQVKVDQSSAAFNFLKEHAFAEGTQYTEKTVLLLLDGSNSIFAWKTMSIGGISGTIMDIRVILQAAIMALAPSIIISHNHPSQRLKPSDADISITKMIKDAAKLCDITLLDHLIVSESSYYSFADEGIL